jgi:hypothetical protein
MAAYPLDVPVQRSLMPIRANMVGPPSVATMETARRV